MKTASVTLEFAYARQLRSSRHIKIRSSGGDMFHVETTNGFLSFEIRSCTGLVLCSVESICPSLIQTLFGKGEFSCDISFAERRFLGSEKKGEFSFQESGNVICSVNKRKRRIDWPSYPEWNVTKPDWRCIGSDCFDSIRSQGMLGVYLGILSFACMLWNPE